MLVLLLLDEPTWDLDPLNTYFIVSILSHHAKKYNRYAGLPVRIAIFLTKKEMIKTCILCC